VIELKRDATADVVLNQLWRHTPAQASFPANMLAIRGGRPETLGLKDIIETFVRFREDVITRRTKFELNKARDRAHILLGLVVAVTNLDEVVVIIRGSSNPAIARERLLAREWPVGDIAPYIRLVEAIADDASDGSGRPYKLSDIQVRAILELRLHRLTALGRDEIGGELETLAVAIRGYLEILADRQKLYAVMRQELVEVKAAFATPRKSPIMPAADGIEDEDLIEREDMVVTVTLDGYIKRTPLSTFRAQNRGGKGRSGMATKQEDAVTTMFVASTHTPVLFFSTAGKVYRLKVWRLPEGGAATRGRPVVNLLPALDKDETVAAVLPLPEDEAERNSLSVVFATAQGNVRRNAMDAFERIPSNGKYAIRFEEDSEDRLIGVVLLDETDDVLLASRQGKAIRFRADDVREFVSRTSTGVRGMSLKPGDEVISLSVLHRVGVQDQDEREDYLRHAAWKPDRDSEPTMSAERFAELAEKEQFILTVCANGFGKLSSAYEYRRTNRGGQGITNIDNIARNGPVVASFPASQADQLMLVTDQAKLIRLPLDTLRVIGRGTAGVRLFNVSGDEHVVGAVRLAEEAEPDDVPGEVTDIAPTEVPPEATSED
jgi:DNA gyrase subunit A